jgi:hypothetical protein
MLRRNLFSTDSRAVGKLLHLLEHLQALERSLS